MVIALGTQPASGPVKGLNVRRLPLSALKVDPANARLHGPRNLDSIAASLARFGQAEPLVVNARSGRLVAGHGRLAAMRKLGWTEADVVELDLAEIDATALGIALNRTAELAEWDDGALASLLAQLKADEALDGLGFDDVEIAKLLADLERDLDGGNVDDPGPEDPPERPVTRLGDLWLLGKHRLLCGDSTQPESLERLMAGEKAQLLATDPPYLVDYTGGNHPPSKANRPETRDKNWDEYKDPETGVAFYDAFLKACLPHVVEDAAIYQWHASRRQGLVETAWQQNGLLVHQTLVWVKARPVLTRSMYLWRSEPCFFGWLQGHMPPKDRRPPTNATNVWEIDQAGEDRPDHPTPKPLEIFNRPISYHTRPGEICLEPFSGGGAQIISAEALKRRCFALELAPGYVDVAVKRWEKATGKQPQLDGGGSFADVARERLGGAEQ